jgi:hypothetical protein
LEGPDGIARRGILTGVTPADLVGDETHFPRFGLDDIAGVLHFLFAAVPDDDVLILDPGPPQTGGQGVDESGKMWA